MRHIACLIVTGCLLYGIGYSQKPTKLWSAPYDIDYMIAKETGFSSDSKYFAIGDDKGKVTIFEAATGEGYATYQFHNSEIYSTVFQPKGHLLASSDKEGKIVLYDYIAKRLVNTIQAHAGAILTLCFNSEGNRLYSGSRDNCVKEWSVPTGRAIRTFSELNGNVRVLRLTSDERTLVAGTSATSNGLVLLDEENGSKNIFSASNVQKLTLTPDGNYAIIASLNKYLSVWSINSGMMKDKIEGHEKYVNDVVLSPDGQILISCSNDETVRIWDFEKRSQLVTIEGDKNYRGLALSPNGKYLATMDEKPLLSVYDVSQYVKVIEPKAVVEAQAKSQEQSPVTITEKKVEEKAPATASASPAPVAALTNTPVKNEATTEVQKTPSVPPGIMKTATGKKVKDIEGKEYNIIKIGTQMWMGENLSVSKFRNGQPIPQAKTEKEWIDAGEKKQPAWCYYDFNPELGNKYGKLYNWYAATDPREIAPDGWHIPAYAEWVELGNTLGGEKKTAHRIKSAAKGEWTVPYITDSISGFNALPSGEAFNTPREGKLFQDIHQKVLWWSSSPSYKNDQMAVVYGVLGQNPEKATSGTEMKASGLAVRCLKGVPYKCKTVKISDYSEWMQTNLDVKTFRNGDPIPQAQTPEEWAKAAREHKPAWCKAPKTKQGDDSYGILYNGYAIYDPRGLAPNGWYIADITGWSGLNLDMRINKFGTEGSLEAMKEEGYLHWDSVKTTEHYNTVLLDKDFKLAYLEGTTNASNFKALPSGRRLADGKFVEQGQSAYFWGKEHHHYGDKNSFALISILTDAILQDPKDDLTKFVHIDGTMGEGYSVRCLKQGGNYILE